MTDKEASIQQLEEKIDHTLWSLERRDDIDRALAVYRRVEAKLMSLDIPRNGPNYIQQQRVLAYCLMRQGNVLRQLGRPQEALALSQREITAARASGDDIALARSLMSAGVNHIVSGQIEQGRQMLDDASALFERGDSDDHQQGLGWYWIVQADLINGGVLEEAASEAISAATQALEILMPIENWAGVARAYAARARTHDAIGEAAAAAMDRKAQSTYESKAMLAEK